MNLPRFTTVGGAYLYLMALLMVLALAFTIIFGAMYFEYLSFCSSYFNDRRGYNLSGTLAFSNIANTVGSRVTPILIIPRIFFQWRHVSQVVQHFFEFAFSDSLGSP